MGEKEGWLNPSNLHWCVLITSLLVVAWVLGCPASLLTASPSHFLPPLQDHVSSHRRIGRAHLAETSLSKAHKLLWQENLSQGILWPVPLRGSPCKRPSGVIARHQIWQLSPRLEHGHVESIDQLAQYHTQFNTPTEWRHQFCSGETRLDRYAVYPKWLAFGFGKPKKQSCSVEYLSFLIRVVLDLICWYPVCHAFNHRIEGVSPPVFQFPPLTSEGI